MKTQSLSQYRNFTKKRFNDAAKSAVLNNQIKPQEEDFFERCSSEFLISKQTPKTKVPDEDNFDAKRAIKPILITAGAALGAVGIISAALGQYSKSLAKNPVVIRPPDLARNINIVEEPQFAMYRALRDPNAKNILGLIGVGVMSGVTLIAKSVADGIKDVWIKKKECDNRYHFEKESIDLETKAFSGKLGVVNNMLSDTKEYFKNQISFKGNNKEEKENSKKPYIFAALGVAGFSALSFFLFKNYSKTLKNLDTFLQKTTNNEIRARIEGAALEPDKNKAIKLMSDVLKTINATEDKVKEHLGSIKGITEEELAAAAQEIKAAQIYVKAPEALGGVSEKIQYYCYINEDRGHLYNWILNPENKFNKYVFLSFSAISALGYVAQTAADAIKQVTVQKENTKSELKLKEKLVDVEIENFRSKKQSALEPMLENFREQKKKNKSKEELEDLAKNILSEIKNGPPYVYD